MHHDPEPERRGARIWLIAGTGEGPLLAVRLLERGWRLKVSVVTAAAALAYRLHPRLELAVGAIGGAAPASHRPAPRGVAAELDHARRSGDPFALVIDASHPFATRIRSDLAEACRVRGQILLRLGRPAQPSGSAELLADLADLCGRCGKGEPLLLAIGARRLAEAVRFSPEARHHARILPSPGALSQALAAGLPPERLACLRPGGDGAIECALCRRWGIRTILCRQSGGVTESLWRDTCDRLGLRLLLIRRPGEPAGTPVLPLSGLIEHVGWAGGRR